MVKSLIWKREKPSNTISLGGQEIEIKPLTLENSLRLFLLMAPYVGAIESKWPELIKALSATDGTRPGLLEYVFMDLRQELTFIPGDLVTSFALCLDLEPEFVARNATAKDIIEAWPILDSVNDFRSLFLACKQLGIAVRYAD